MESLRQGQIKDFRSQAGKLDDYLLRPYLDYKYLRNRIASVSNREVLQFINANADLPVTELLHKRWLRELGKRRQWQVIRDNSIVTRDTELRCYHLRALYGTGDIEQALDESTALWTQPKSQPKACDPLFEVWRNTSRFTESVVWTRFSAAIMANQVKLASYLIRYLSGDNKSAGEAFYGVHVTPTRIASTNQYKNDTPKYRQLIAHGLERLANRDADKAAKAWRSYARSHSFDAHTSQRIDDAIAVAQANENGSFPTPERRAGHTSASAIENLSQAAVESQNWQETRYWISQLPDDIRGKSQWQYWLGHAQGLLNTGVTATLDQERFNSLALQRHYYGFLAARSLGLPGRLNADARNATSVNLARLQLNPGINRSIELFAVGDELNGRREWYKALTTLPHAEQVLAAELAQSIGLVSLAIRTANIAEARDHLHLRFPLAHEPQFRRASLSSALPTALLMAVARQESAMQSDARSSADARGLMQLLPSTARLVARRARQPIPETSDLYDPTTNITLGSYHLAWLMERYNGQAPAALAAYNAGEHRVDRWIKDADGMPMAVWIERIPYRETRNYVKNVLAFRYVYGELLASPAPILGAREQTLRIP